LHRHRTNGLDFYERRESGSGNQAPRDTLNTTIHWSAIMPTSIRLDTEIEKRLENLAGRTGRTKAYYLRELVEQGLDDLEDYYLAAEELERVRKGESKVYSAAEVRVDLGFDH
jgi:RHH-type rel operon transcriptional repressor/antitoxin RelB